METIVNSLYEPTENLYTAIGASSPLSRALVTAAATSIAVLTIKPAAMFQNGQPRPFVFATGAKEASRSGIEPTYTPWWSAPVVLGVVGAVFI